MKCPRSQKAFSVIEVLVVMGILAIGFFFIMPAFQSALAGSRNATCISNLRQIFAAATVYSGEHNGGWPISYSSGSGMSFATTLNEYLGPYPPSKEKKGAWRRSLIICPADRYGPDQREEVYEVGSPKHGLSYAQNVYLYSDTPSYMAGNRAAVANPSKLAAYMDWENHYLASHQTLNNEEGGRKEALKKRHSGSINVVFADGHLEPVLVDSIPDAKPPPVLFWSGRSK